MGDAVLSAEEAWFRYEPQGPDVVRGLSLELRRGELLALLGGNGTGKSTSLRLLAGISKPQRGSITCRGTVGVLPQDPQTLFVKKTVREDLFEMLPKQTDRREERVARVAALCQLEELLDNIVDMYSCEAPMQYIGQQMQTTKAIRARLDKLTSQSVEYIMESLSNTTQPIKNIRAYLRTVILNAPGTMESYYQVQANAAVAASSHPPAPAGSLMAGAVRHFGQKRRDGT